MNFDNLAMTLADIIVSLFVEPTFLDPRRCGRLAKYRFGRELCFRRTWLRSYPAAGEGLEVAVRLWLDEKDGQSLKRVVLAGPVLSTDSDETVRRLTLDDLNEPVDISIPE